MATASMSTANRGGKCLDIVDLDDGRAVRIALAAAEELAEFGLDRHAHGAGHFEHFLRQRDVLLQRQLRAVAHDRGETGTQRLHAIGERLAVVEVQGDGDVGRELVDQVLDAVGDVAQAGIPAIVHVALHHHGGLALGGRFQDGAGDVVIAAVGIHGGNGVTALVGGLDDLSYC